MKYNTKPRTTKRVQIDCSQGGKTDQSFAKAVNINNIVRKFQKTGILPTADQDLRFGDFSEVPSLEEAHEAVKLARQAFYGLPSDIRKLMDNDASKLELWLSDENNHDLARKHGLLKAKPQEVDLPGRLESNDSTSDVTDINGGDSASTSN